MVSCAPPTSTSAPSVSAAPPLRPISSSLYGSCAELGLRVGVADLAAGEVLPGADDLLHLLLERGEVLGGEGPLGVEVVVEAVLDRRADAEPRAGEQLLHGLGEHVGGRVPDDRAAVGAGGGHRLDVGVGLGSPVQVLEVAAGDLADDDGAVGALERDPGVLERLHRRRPGRDPDRGDGGRRGRGGHRNSWRVWMGRDRPPEPSARLRLSPGRWPAPRRRHPVGRPPRPRAGRPRDRPGPRARSRRRRRGAAGWPPLSSTVNRPSAPRVNVKRAATSSYGSPSFAISATKFPSP